MLSTYTTIGQSIRELAKSIRWIDLDKGQLDNPELFNSIIVPGVLIGQADITWTQLARRKQIGTGTITVKCVFVLPIQTHLTDPLLSKSLQILELADVVNSAVLDVPGITGRTATSNYPSGSFYVVENTYQARFESGPDITYKTVEVHLNPTLFNPHAQA